MQTSVTSFRPQQGLTIMNNLIIGETASRELKCFRPQQGLTIMNKQGQYDQVDTILFPSPTGVNYYE